MKVVHINRKDIDKEQAYLEKDREIIRQQAEREYRLFLKRRVKSLAKEQANRKAGISTIHPSETTSKQLTEGTSGIYERSIY